jgi:hypothetical protein
MAKMKINQQNLEKRPTIWRKDPQHQAHLADRDSAGLICIYNAKGIKLWKFCSELKIN